MQKIKSKEQEVWEGKRIFIGIDVHRKSWTVSGVCEAEEVLHRTIPARFEALEKQLKPFIMGGAKIEVVYEACGFGYNLYDRLNEGGIEAYVTAPSTIPRAASDRVKTDKRDSRKLATLLYQGTLKMVPVPAPRDRIERALVRGRKQLVGESTRIKLRIKSLLSFFGYTGEIRKWSKGYIEQLKELSKTEDELEMLGVWIELLEKTEEKIKVLDKQIEKLSMIEKYRSNYQKLKSIPGVGPVTAMTVLTELQNFKPFTSTSELASYVGLVPTERSTGLSQQRQGSITKTGNRWVRAVLIEAAWTLVKKDGIMATHYRKVLCRNAGQWYGKQIAIVAVARRLLVRMYAIVKKEQMYAVGLVA